MENQLNNPNIETRNEAGAVAAENASRQLSSNALELMKDNSLASVDPVGKGVKNAIQGTAKSILGDLSIFNSAEQPDWKNHK